MAWQSPCGGVTLRTDYACGARWFPGVMTISSCDFARCESRSDVEREIRRRLISAAARSNDEEIAAAADMIWQKMRPKAPPWAKSLS